METIGRDIVIGLDKVPFILALDFSESYGKRSASKKKRTILGPKKC